MRGSRSFRQNYWPFLAQLVPPFTTRVYGGDIWRCKQELLKTSRDPIPYLPTYGRRTETRTVHSNPEDGGKNSPYLPKYTTSHSEDESWVASLITSDVRNDFPPARQQWRLRGRVICLVGRHVVRGVPVFEQIFHCKIDLKPSATPVKCWWWFPVTYMSLNISWALSAEPSFSGDASSSVRLSKESVKAPDYMHYEGMCVIRQDICGFTTWWLIL